MVLYGHSAVNCQRILKLGTYKRIVKSNNCTKRRKMYCITLDKAQYHEYIIANFTDMLRKYKETIKSNTYGS